MALNGRFPASLLAYLGWPEADHLRLRPDAAASITRLAAAFERRFGKPLYLSDAYRTYAQQVKLKATKGKFAATPGTSNHGWGVAIDAASRVNVDGSAEHRWMEANAPAYGWFNPLWARDYNSNNGEHEPWHWEYVPAADTHTSAPTQEDDMSTPAEVWSAMIGSGTDRRTVAVALARAQHAAEAAAAAVPNLVGAIAAIGHGEAFDEAKLLAGVQASASKGARAGTTAALADLDQIVRDALADVAGADADAIVALIATKLNAPAA